MKEPFKEWMNLNQNNRSLVARTSMKFTELFLVGFMLRKQGSRQPKHRDFKIFKILYIASWLATGIVLLYSFSWHLGKSHSKVHFEVQKSDLMLLNLSIIVLNVYNIKNFNII